MRAIAKIFFINVKDLVIFSTCNICGGQLTGTLIMMQAVVSAFIRIYQLTYITFLNQKDCRQQKFLP